MSRWQRWSLQFCLVICLSAFSGDQAFAQNAQIAGDEQEAGEQARQDAGDSKYSEMSFDEIGEDFMTNMRAYTKRYRAAPTKKEKSAVARTIPSTKAYQTRLVELIEEEPGSQTGLEIVDWWYRRGGRRHSTKVLISVILKNYSKLESIEKYVPWVASYLPAEEAGKELETLLEVSPFAAVQASAAYHLHEVLRRQLKDLNGESAEAVTAKVQTLRELIANKYADAADIRGAKFLDLIVAVEFAANLEVGKTVPDIIGTDLQGVEFKLSDYTGKVIVVSFWGDW